MIDVREIENQITAQEKNATDGDHSLAYMLLLEVKASARRWFIVAVIELAIILGIVAGLLWYVSLPAESYTEALIDTEGNANSIVGVGDVYGDTREGKNIH